MTTDILNYIDQLSATYHSLLPMSPENQRRWDKKVRLEYNYNSNHIEGNTLTYGDTQLLLLFDETRCLLRKRILGSLIKLFSYSLFGKTLLPPMGTPPAGK